ncbi:Arc family DNA-binding protein [Pseudomonas sp. GZD-222]|uniref:Arc family DNA-binding protein n=1 Tax=Pseudomonas sp. GZD-222 TaxID=3404805 RepID=UPI003BB74FC6
MSRTDPQFNLRIPESLRDQVMAAAKENGRSATAEILARLELSFIGEAPQQELIPAARAKEMSSIARQSIPGVVKKRILDGVNQAVAMGHASAHIELGDLEIEAMPEADMNGLMDAFTEWLEAAGYNVEWDGPDHLSVRFDEW